jgi:hypothetical protein
MLTTSDLVREKRRQFQRGGITQAALVAWAEQTMQEGNIVSDATDAVARIGLADVAAFALTASDIESLLGKLPATTATHRA